MKTIDMFYNFDADALWEGMPEFTQHEEPDPVITATFKFRTEEDFDVFKKKVQKHIFNNTGPFRGEQSAGGGCHFQNLFHVKAHYCSSTDDLIRRRQISTG